jgi:hypothetical protein
MKALWRKIMVMKMDCALSASWEADIIILWFCVNDAAVVEK